MSHSKGFLQGRCPGKWRNVGRKKLGMQQQKCTRCGRLRQHKVGRCFIFHDWHDRGRANHGKQAQRCEKCGDTRTATFSGCGLLARCRWHNCDKVEGLHCARCARRRRQ